MILQVRKTGEGLGAQMGREGRSLCRCKLLALSSSAFFMQRKQAATLTTVSEDFCLDSSHKTVSAAHSA